MKNAVPGCVACCLLSFLASFPVLLYLSCNTFWRVLESWPLSDQVLCSQFARCISPCPAVTTQALTKALHWEERTVKIERAVWTDVGSVAEFTSCEQRWLSTDRVCLSRACSVLCCFVAAKMRYSCGGSGWGLFYATAANCVRRCAVVLWCGFPKPPGTEERPPSSLHL